MFSKLISIKERFEQLNKALSAPDVVNDQEQFRKLSKERSDLEELVAAYDVYCQQKQELATNQQLESNPQEDAELREMAHAEVQDLLGKIAESENLIRQLLLPKDPDDSRNIILEIRAGTGGEEAALFVKNLFRMYTKYAELRRWKVEIIDEHATDIGGYKEVILSIAGKDVYSRLKFEGGVHRVQRIPRTETQGRVHTSAATVVVLPEVEDVEVNINPGDIRVDVYRSSGPGGQSVNTTDSAVRITHLPTGLVVTCQNEKSQHKNKAQALKVLRARIYEQELATQQDEASAKRKQMVGSGDRSERIRTYNFPQGRLTDHRVNLTLYQLENILEGNIDQVIEPLMRDHQARLLNESMTVSAT